MMGCFGCGFTGNLVTLLKHFHWGNSKIQAIAGSGVKVTDDAFTWAYELPDDADERQSIFAHNEYMKYSMPMRIRQRIAAQRRLKLTTIDEAHLLYDPVQKRVLFPWRINGRILGMTGRLLSRKPVDGVAKTLPYANFIKSSCIYFPKGTSLSEFPQMVICEGEFSALKVFDAGAKNVCAIGFGAISSEQLDLLIDSGVQEIVTFFDNDRRGRQLTDTVYKRVDGKMFVYAANYDKLKCAFEGCDPGDLNGAAIRKALRLKKDAAFS